MAVKSNNPEILEHAVDVLAQTGGYMYGAQIVLIHLVGNEFIGYLGFVEQPRCISLINFHHNKLQN